MIPKRISFTWSGKRMSWLRYMTLWSFRKYNPDYDIYLYITPDSHLPATSPESNRQDYLNMSIVNHFDKLDRLGRVNIIEVNPDCTIPNPEPAHKHDWLRWSILSKDGGYYSDMDILFLQSIDNLKIDRQWTDVVFNYAKWMSIGFLGASPGNPYNVDMWRLCKNRRVRSPRYQSYGVDLIYHLLSNGETIDYTPSYQWSKLLMQRYQKLNFFNIPNPAFYKFSYNQISDLFAVTNQLGVDQSMIGCHWFGGTAVAQGFNSWATEDNYQKAGQVGIVSLLNQVLAK
jgi:hypothetical protein